MGEDEGFVLGEGEFVLLELITVWVVDCAEFGLEEEGGFVAWEGYVNFDGESDAWVTVDFAVEGLFTSFQADLAEFVALGDYVELI
jgi:hypothetical protein